MVSPTRIILIGKKLYEEERTLKRFEIPACDLQPNLGNLHPEQEGESTFNCNLSNDDEADTRTTIWKGRVKYDIGVESRSTSARAQAVAPSVFLCRSFTHIAITPSDPNL